MPKIYLARHGQDEDNANGILNGRRDTPLTKKGMEQAQALAENITEHNLPIQKVYTSPLKRAYQTAEIITEALALPKPESEPLLIEREFGRMTGQSIKDVEQLCAPDVIRTDTVTYFLCPQDAETFPQLKERAENLLAKLAEDGDMNNVLLVTHGDIGKMVYAAFYGIDWKDALTQFHFGNSEVLLLQEGAQPAERHIYQTQQENH